MKKFTAVLISLFLLTNICFSQSGWYNTFVNNASVINKIAKRDSSTYFAFTQSSIAFLKSTDSGNNWLSFNGFDTAYTMYDAFFINQNIGWVVGTRIYKTTNGGINWEKQNLGMSLPNLYSCYFMNENTGWIGGDNILLMTTNGGVNWSIQNFPNASAIRKINFLNSNTGYILGQNGYVGKSTNSGFNWVRIFTNTVISDKLMSDIYNIDTTNFWILAQGYYPNLTGYIFRTSNSGLNWDTLYSYSTGQIDYLTKIFFPDGNTGYTCGGSNRLFKTTNLGTTWFPLTNHVSANFYSMLTKNSNGIFIGGGNYGNSFTPYDNFIIYSSNGGSNWDIKNHKWNYQFREIQFVDYNVGYTVADSGRIYKTSNSGLNWNLALKAAKTDFTSLSFLNLSTGFAVGSIMGYSYWGVLFKSTNAGSTWDSIRIFTPTYKLNNVTFINQNIGFILSSTGNLYRTSDSGFNWDTIALPISHNFDLTDIFFLNYTDGWLLTNYWHYTPIGGYNEAIVLKSTNSGNNWFVIYNNSGSTFYKQFKFINQSTGLMLTQQGFQKTTDGGNTWLNIYNNTNFTSNCFFMVNENTGWVGCNDVYSYGKIIKTTNGGLNWFSQFLEYGKIPRSIYAFDTEDAWFCGDYSSIYRTTNGGGLIGINITNNYIPTSPSLSQNYPNPFNPVTKIKYDVPANVKEQTANVKLIIYDVLGREIETLVKESQKPGSYEVTWDGSRYASGVYFYKLMTEEFTKSKRMVLIK